MLISKLVLGTVQIGLPYGVNNLSGQPSKEEAFDMLNLAYDSGIRTLDTAESYGQSQLIIGAFHRCFPGKRFDVLTKFKDDTRPLEAKLLDSLDILNVLDVSLYSFHDPSGFKNKQLCGQLESLKAKKLVKSVGVSIYLKNEFEEVINHPLVDVIQTPYNLLDNWKKRGDLILKAKEKGKIIHCRSIFLQGLFQKNIETFPQKIHSLKSPIKSLYELAFDSNLSITELALKYVIQNRNIDNVLVGVDKASQLAELLSNSDTVLSDHLISSIECLNVDNDLLDPRFWT